MRVCLFTSSLGCGGAERVAVLVAGWLAQAGHAVRLVTLSDASDDHFACPQGVERIGMRQVGASRHVGTALTSNLRRVKALRRVFVDGGAEVVVSLIDRCNVLALLAARGLSCRKIISERSDPERDPLEGYWAVLRKLTYPSANLHVSQSSYLNAWIARRFPTLACTTIGNPSPTVDGQTLADPSVLDPAGILRMLTVGRLSVEKGQDLLLQAVARSGLASAGKLRLAICGDGPERDNLRALRDRLGLGAAVTFEGTVTDVERYYREADLFVLSSRLEGFPNAMIEAMAYGVPVVASRCRGGVEDILENDACGLSVHPGDADALAQAIVRVHGEPELRVRLARGARARALDYSEQRIAAAWVRAVEGG